MSPEQESETLLDVNQHTQRHSEGGEQPVKGYRQLDTVTASRINSIKVMENEVGKLYQSLLELGQRDWPAGEGPVDLRLLAAARTDLQKGFMLMVRSIAQPESEL